MKPPHGLVQVGQFFGVVSVAMVGIPDPHRHHVEPGSPECRGLGAVQHGAVK